MHKRLQGTAKFPCWVASTVPNDSEQNRLATPDEIGSLRSLSLHASRVLLPLSEMLDSFAKGVDPARSRRLLEFFEFVKIEYSDSEYALLQKAHLSAQNIKFICEENPISSEVKYFDFPFWAQSKFNIGTRLKLEQYAGEHILDIGAGPGHFGVVARYFGCGYDGLEVPLLPRTPYNKRHLFDDFCEFFRVERMFNPVRPMLPLTLERRYRLVTCLMGNFCAVIFKDGSRRAWTWPEWVFFLEDLIGRALESEFNMYFNVSRDFLPPDVMENLRRFSKTFDETSCVFTFDQSLDLEALRRSSLSAP
jgi:hypothetical protein